MRRDGTRDPRAGRGEERAPPSRVADLVQDESGGECERENEQLGAREEREQESRQGGEVPPGRRCGDGSLAEEKSPDEGRVRRVLRQERRGEYEPRRAGGEGCGRIARGTRVRDRPSEQERGDGRTRDEKRVQRVGGRRRSRCVQGPVEGCEEERVELAVCSVVDPMDGRDRRQTVGDARREPRHLELVRHDRPRRDADRVVEREAHAGEHACRHGHGCEGQA